MSRKHGLWGKTNLGFSLLLMCDLGQVTLLLIVLICRIETTPRIVVRIFEQGICKIPSH